MSSSILYIPESLDSIPYKAKLLFCYLENKILSNNWDKFSSTSHTEWVHITQPAMRSAISFSNPNKLIKDHLNGIIETNNKYNVGRFSKSYRLVKSSIEEEQRVPFVLKKFKRKVISYEGETERQLNEVFNEVSIKLTDEEIADYKAKLPPYKFNGILYSLSKFNIRDFSISRGENGNRMFHLFNTCPKQLRNHIYYKDNDCTKWLEREEYENHHIVPLEMGGPDTPDNIIAIPFVNHQLAHQLLHEMYPDNVDLKKTLNLMMNRGCNGGKNNPNYGKTHSAEARKKMGDALIKPLTAIEIEHIKQFDNWLEKHPGTISNSLRKQGITIGPTRIKRLQEDHLR